MQSIRYQKVLPSHSISLTAMIVYRGCSCSVLPEQCTYERPKKHGGKHTKFLLVYEKCEGRKTRELAFRAILRKNWDYRMTVIRSSKVYIP